MYALSDSNRIYTLIFLCLCAAFFLAPTVANANEYWSVLEKRFIPADRVPNAVQEMLGHKVSRPSGSTLSTVPSAPTVTKNPLGGLSQTSQNIIKTMGQPSTFNSTLNNTVGAAKTALKSCVRSPACAVRGLGAVGVIYEGIHAWKDVYDLTLGSDGTIYKPSTTHSSPSDGYIPELPEDERTSSYVRQNAWGDYASRDTGCPNEVSGGLVVSCTVYNDLFYRIYYCPRTHNGLNLMGYAQHSRHCQYDVGSEYIHNEPVPVTYDELDDLIDEGYFPEVSDAPIVLLSGEPETISLSTPASAELPATTTTSTDSQGKTTTTVKNAVITYSVLNNNSSSPSIESTVTETTNTYDETANLVGSMTSTTTNNPVAPDPLTPPSSGASADIELPPFCTYASIVCDWIGWTKEGIEGEEPDLINLISEFEPDENGYNSGIGSGSCPAPMSLNLGIIDRTVEVSYQPFCDFLDMIRPLVIAGAWLLSAFMYVGVLRRG